MDQEGNKAKEVRVAQFHDKQSSVGKSVRKWEESTRSKNGDESTPPNFNTDGFEYGEASKRV